jgi:hypothetical protein
MDFCGLEGAEPESVSLVFCGVEVGARESMVMVDLKDDECLELS